MLNLVNNAIFQNIFFGAVQGSKSNFEKNAAQEKKMLTISHLGGGSGLIHFPHFQK